MNIILIRSLILYVLVIFSVRLMGKRQLGELQPSELVITILISNIATLPLEDVDIPVIIGAVPILSLVCFEVIMSWLILKFPKLRKIVSGSPKIIIRNGELDVHTMRELRLSVDDLLTAVRGRDIFDLNEIQYAIVETTGSFSIMKKQSADTPTRNDLSLKCECADPPILIISDGRLLENAVKCLGFTAETICRTIKNANGKINDILLMTCDASGNCCIVWKNSRKIFKGKTGVAN